MKNFSKDEMLETYRRYLDVRNRIEVGELKWSALADFFTTDATYVDPAWGRVDGRDNIIRFMDESMEGLEGWTFPHEWETVDGNYIIAGWENRLPGRRADGTSYQAPGMSRILYVGDGKFSYNQDLLNMAHIMELIAESGWIPIGNINMPPEGTVRMCAWDRDA